MSLQDDGFSVLPPEAQHWREKTVSVPRHGCVLVAPRMLRQVFNDTPEDALWLIVAAPQEGSSGSAPDPSRFYPEDPKSLPAEFAGREWPPA